MRIALSRSGQTRALAAANWDNHPRRPILDPGI